MQDSVIAILSGKEQSARCATALKEIGFTRDDISLLLPDEFGAQELGFYRHSHALNGVAIGAIMGTLAGAILGYLNYDMHLWPALTNLTDNKLIPAIAVMAIFGECILALCSGLIGLAMPEYAVRKYARKSKLRNSLMSVHVDNVKQMQVAQKLLRMEGAQDINVIDSEVSQKKQEQMAIN